MKKIAALLLAGAMVFSAFSGVSSALAQEPRKDLTFAFFRDVESLSPHTTAGEMWFQEMVFEGLVAIENEGIKPALAESWTISPDGKVYTFKIRQGVKFTDGTPLTAHVVKENFDNIIKDKNSLKWLESVVLTKEYKALDDYTFELTLASPYYPLLAELGMARPFGMGSPKTFVKGEPRKVTAAVGTGPYVMGEHKQDEYLNMYVNKDYWGKKPSIEKITMRVIPESQTRILALENGEIDMVYGANVVDATTIQMYKNSDKIKYAVSEPSLTKHMVINSHLPGLNDLAVRQAINYAVNREAISQGIYYGLEKPAGTLYSESTPYCDIDLTPYTYDLKKAEKLLDDAGWKKGSDGVRAKDGVRLAFSVIYDNNTVTDKPTLEFIQSEFKSLGIDLKLEGYERSTYFDKQKAGEFQIIMGIPWGKPYDPHASLASFRAPSYGDYQGLSGLANSKEIFDGITEMLVEVDEAKRQAEIKDILTKIHDSAVHVPLVFGNNKTIYTGQLKTVTFAPSVYTFPFWEFEYK